MKEIARKIELPCHGIVVTLTGERDPERPSFRRPAAVPSSPACTSPKTRRSRGAARRIQPTSDTRP